MSELAEKTRLYQYTLERCRLGKATHEEVVKARLEMVEAWESHYGTESE